MRRRGGVLPEARGWPRLRPAARGGVYRRRPRPPRVPGGGAWEEGAGPGGGEGPANCVRAARVRPSAHARTNSVRGATCREFTYCA